MDYEKTVNLYHKYSLNKAWEQLLENNRHNKETKWTELVTSTRSGEYWQAEELRNREMVPSDWESPHKDQKGKPLKYPIKIVNCIYRRRIIDGSEWLVSRQTWIGLDSRGNPQSISMDDKEVYDDILPIYKSIDKNPKDRDSQLVRVIDHIEHRRKYTLPYTPDNVQKLYDMKSGSWSLIVMDESNSDSRPISVGSVEHFKNKPFNELWNMAKIPKHNLGN